MAMLKHKIDYISYTFYSEKVELAPHTRQPYEVLNALPDYIERPEIWTNAPKRRGFHGGLNIDNHTFVFYNDQGLMLIEHTGAGCDWLDERGVLLQTLNQYAHRLSRIDIATDIETPVRPLDFVAQSQASRLTADGHVKSSKGETRYVGSKNSERCCKVYRYDGQHPRSHLLRVEYTYRKEQARILGDMLKSLTIEECALRSSERYKWGHEVWKKAVTGQFEPIKAWRPERKHGKTVNWIYSQVVPAIVKLVKIHAIDLDHLIDTIRKECEK